MTTTADTGGFTPRTFALSIYPDGATRVLVAWGMTLPDGSAVTVEWRHGPSSVVSLCGSVDRAALLHQAEIDWTDQPGPAEEPP